MKRIEELDGIRGIAILAILMLHMAEILVAGVGYSRGVAAAYRLMYSGWLGVDIFFVLSGFLITRILLNKRAHPESHQSPWVDFYLRRTVRILPAFTVVFALTIFALHFFHPEIHLSARILLPAIFFFENWTVLDGTTMPFLPHLWSLAIEEQFYLLWPQAAKRLSGRTVLAIALAMVALCEVLRIVLAMRHVPAPVVYAVTPTRIDGLSIGSALAVAMTMPRVRRFLRRAWPWISLAALLLLAFISIRLRGSLTAYDVRSQLLAIPPVIVLVAMLIYASVESALPRMLSRALSNAALTYLGRRSYALYLIHYPIVAAVVLSRMHGHLAALPPGVMTNLGLIAAVLATSLLLSEASWRWIETPAQTLRQRWTQR